MASLDPTIIPKTPDWMMQTTGFGRQLKMWRNQAKLSQRELDLRLDKTRGFTNNLESGLTRGPPDRATCLQIGEVLETSSPGEVWEAACEEKLAQTDPEFRDWLATRYERTALGPAGAEIKVTDDECALIDYLRWLDELYPPGADDEPVAAHLSDLCLAVLVDALPEAPGRTASPDTRALVDAIRRFDDIPTAAQRGVCRLFVQAFDIAQSARLTE